MQDVSSESKATACMGSEEMQFVYWSHFLEKKDVILKSSLSKIYFKDGLQIWVAKIEVDLMKKKIP